MTDLASPVLMYHSVSATVPDHLRIAVTPARFRAQLHWLADRGFRAVGLHDLERREARGERRLVGLTFDDGYADFLHHAHPAIREVGFSATLFPVVHLLGGNNDWDPPPRRPLLTVSELRAVADDGIEVGSHGLSHLHLTAAAPEVRHDEIVLSRTRLTEILGRDVTSFSYPYGDVNATVAHEVRAAGYLRACAVRMGRGQSGRYTRARIYIGQADGPARMTVKLLRHQLGQRSLGRSP